jgi:hypothetical protein
MKEIDELHAVLRGQSPDDVLLGDQSLLDQEVHDRAGADLAARFFNLAAGEQADIL